MQGEIKYFDSFKHGKLNEILCSVHNATFKS